jgi:TetR/AcrR family transcriptional regulator, regulator of autoinduction and epiphytic fitness
MKTTRAQQEQTRRQITRSAVELICTLGYENATMKQIARAAQIGDATIYKYFPTKEKLVLGYFDQVAADAVQATLRTPGLTDYSLHEKLQRLTDAVLELILPDREFVAIAHRLLARAPLLLGEQLPARVSLSQAALGFLEAAEQRAEMPRLDFKATLAGLYGDYLLGVIAYWLADDSDEFADTTQFVDLSLGVLTLALCSGLLNRILELGGFVLRHQVARLMSKRSGALDLLRLARHAVQSADASRVTAAPQAKSKPLRQRSPNSKPRKAAV